MTLTIVLIVMPLCYNDIDINIACSVVCSGQGASVPLIGFFVLIIGPMDLQYIVPIVMVRCAGCDGCNGTLC